jgi:hypothetical protein
MQSSAASILQARIETVPYWVGWAILLYFILAFQVVGTRALSDHNSQVIGIQAYNTSEQNHWCDLNPLLDTNADVTLTNVSYVLLQKVPRVRVKIRTCKVTETVIPLYCGNYDHQTIVMCGIVDD